MEKEINATNHFNKWFKGLKDVVVKRKVLARLDRLKNDNFGDFHFLVDDQEISK